MLLTSLTTSWCTGCQGHQYNATGPNLLSSLMLQDPAHPMLRASRHGIRAGHSIGCQLCQSSCSLPIQSRCRSRAPTPTLSLQGATLWSAHVLGMQRCGPVAKQSS